MNVFSSISKSAAEDLISVIACDRSGRGISKLGRAEDWRSAASAFAQLGNVVVISGFYVYDAHTAETDGPGGAVMLARAFLEEGRRAQIWTDKPCIEIIKAAARSVSFPEDLVGIAPENLDNETPDGIIFTERPGRAADGHYYNFRKKDISAWTAPLDDLAADAAKRGIVTLGIGDGGNEAGMGAFYEEMKKMHPEDADCFSTVRTDHALAADVSNWGAYAFAAALSCIWGSWRGPNDGEELAMLKAEAACGAADGMSGRPELTVDGFGIDVQSGIISALKKIWEASVR